MRLYLAISLFAVLSAIGAAAQMQQPPATGLEAPWDARKILTDLAKNTSELGPLLQQLNPQQWVNTKGAPTTFILQWQSAQQQLNNVSVAAKQLAQKSEDLPMSLDLYFRLEALEVTTRALNEGVQRYADRSTANRMNVLIARNFDNRQRFRDYLRDLASNLEQNFKIADGEAQRCRGTISKEPAPPRGRSSWK